MNPDVITLHVTSEIFRLMYYTRNKTVEYRPLNEYYFKLLDKFRILKQLRPNYLIRCRIYEAYTKRYFTATVLSIAITQDVPDIVYTVYKNLPKGTNFYKIDLLY